MSLPLWTLEEFVRAVDGTVAGTPADAITGISIDSRTLEPGDAFVAIAGERFDGHDFVEAALTAGASLALVARDRLASLPADGRYVVVEDVLEALRQLGRAARARSSARIVAVTGSVGKTSTKEALRLALSRCGKTHASVASFNNHWGVPLTLARMPRDVAFGVFEIGMNHAGEITPLVQMVRPHVAIITTVQAVHLEFFDSVEGIAKAKAEIFNGLEPGGVAILNQDNDQFDLLTFLARTTGVETIRTFGEREGTDGQLLRAVGQTGTSVVQARILGEEITYKIGAPGRHFVVNSLAVLLAVVELGADLALAGLALSELSAPKGRGAQTRLLVPGGSITIIDESYNANPASMRAALSLLGESPVALPGRRIAVVGDMLELGETAAQLHAELVEPMQAAKVDRVYCAGPLMHALWQRLPTQMRAHYAEQSAALLEPLKEDLRAGDVIMIKGSLGSRMGPLVEALKQDYAAADETVAV
ncbi:UDP-N-acetylmuramoylalanyl-D-glutamyl-2,6-diaminopimelate--D-alanyl-D-alanine ligase [Microvirga tunisiensis]|uniref:UDP-N-acetylmuramoyl-tripeptide--D-alanyl-D-alanine ligase n=2 Tax=Pannonibacter tanglangensis TaxID=2750084 RepID=A0A7X5EZI3_9HYPH|nr:MULTISPECIES: UDP-N-acetylmuramoylalanyl-D-glutamyl-2,6-diaminopimelate--D-alanyl-D-alanine ligase [unclassified Pannonibacter]NBN63368.1 UDP-N-acetylmuramoylalanyl-D-glutamyl-2,6-diaminopimelate--D-alanyl-D-alanine ligase [Pannonibacter sp. XCT-34]NBN77003.1 UDP-N-acetylmuramoylalanyl-D-glutamyl-2,6-diaminopimelate--D-alanyl-D-alanine ligase [Pannonibacter sp. XCT-53]